LKIRNSPTKPFRPGKPNEETRRYAQPAAKQRGPLHQPAEII
jgi:hypothetical protein